MKKLNELKLKNKKYIIFDMDGTLIDSIGIWNLIDHKLIKDYGNKVIDLDKIQRDREIFINKHNNTDIYLTYCKDLIEKYNLNINNNQELLKIRQKISGDILEKEVDFKPYSKDLLLKFKKLGFTLVLATMTSQYQLDIYSKKNKKMLSQLNIYDVFDLVISKENIKNKKPNPEIYNKIIEYYNTSPKECLTFEDSYVGVLSAKKANIEVINVYDKYSNNDRKRINEITDYKINNFKDFIYFIDKEYINS